MRLRLAAVAFSVLLGITGAVITDSPASASTSLKGWMLAQGEYNLFSNFYGSPIPVQWVTCAKYPQGHPSLKSCPTDRLIRETSYFALADEIKKGYIKSGDSVLADYETWNQTPAKQQAHPEKYICLTDQLAAKYHLFLVQSPFNPHIPARVREEVAASSCAATYGANEVTELQYQGREVNPAAYERYVSAAVDAIHDKARHARIMGGLATDLRGHREPIRDIIASYNKTKDMLIGYWLNSTSHTAEGITFLEDIHAISVPRNAKR